VDCRVFAGFFSVKIAIGMGTIMCRDGERMGQFSWDGLGMGQWT